jgi:hypothetical protein
MKKSVLLTFSEHILFTRSKVRDSEILVICPLVGLIYSLLLVVNHILVTSGTNLVNYLQIKSSELGTEAHSSSGGNFVD